MSVTGKPLHVKDKALCAPVRPYCIAMCSGPHGPVLNCRSSTIGGQLCRGGINKDRIIPIKIGEGSVSRSKGTTWRLVSRPRNVLSPLATPLVLEFSLDINETTPQARQVDIAAAASSSCHDFGGKSAASSAGEDSAPCRILVDEGNNG